MGNSWFRFKQFTIHHSCCAMKVNTDSCLLGAWARSDKPKNILDIGAGSGVIGLMLAQRFVDATITLVEIIPECAEQCSQNATKSPFKNRTTCVNTAIQQFNSPFQFDLIVSNPPYFENDTPAAGLTRQAARHHNTLPLAELFESATRLLSPTGFFSVIIPYHRLNQAKELATLNQLFIHEQVAIRSLPNKPITRSLLSFSKQKGLLFENELSIQEYPGKYTQPVINLLSDFYPNL